MNLKYYWINIENSIKRKEFMENQFKNLEYKNIRINAITPDDFSEILEDKPPYFCGNNCCLLNNCNDCKFEYACICSHLKAIQEGLKNGDEYFIVCEDDILIPFEIDFEKIIKNLPKDFDIFQMMVLDEEANNFLYNHLINTNDIYINYNPYKSFYSTGMYLITHNGASKILEKTINKISLKYDFINFNMLKQADFFLYMNVNTYTSTFPLCIPNINLISEIHPQHLILHKKAIIKILEIMNYSDKYPYIKIKKFITNNISNNIKYYWINLDKANNRREFMENQFNLYKINNERISAKTPNDLNDILEDQPPFFCGYKECLENKCKNCSIEFATICSHLEAIKKGYMSGSEYFIVCEDDVIFKYNIDFDKIINNFPTDFEIFQMMIISKNHLNFFYQSCFLKNIFFVKYTPITPSAAFYLISRKGAQQILNKFINKNTNKWDLTNFSGLKLADVLIYQSVNTCVSTFPLCSFNINFKSQIHDLHFQAHNEAFEEITEIQKNYKLNPLIINTLS
jgi:GR25 family glycosyltransferase involved in LPS biosynthesis